MAPLLYDRCRTANLTPGLEPWVLRVYEAMQRAVVFKIDNIADYFWRSEREMWYLDRDYPNLAPPYPLMWMEYAWPKEIFNEQGSFKVPEELQGKRIGILIRVMDGGPAPECRWSLLFHCLNETLDASGVELLPGEVLVGVTDHGQLAHYSDGRPVYGPLWDNENPPDAEVEQVLKSHLLMLHPAYLTLSFLHCKNVELVEQGGEKRDPQTGKRIRPRRGARAKHYTIHIEAMKKILRREGESDRKGLKHALSVCRGHFKHFGPADVSGHPQGLDTGLLFGKHAGMYWWESQARLAPGEKPPTYTVDPPKPDNDEAGGEERPPANAPELKPGAPAE